MSQIKKINRLSPSALQVLVAPLDWGLGHATRCIPIIKELMQAGFTILIAASGPQKTLLQAEFPQLGFLELPGYGIRHVSGRKRLIRGLILEVPRILAGIRREHAWIKKLCRERQIDIILSDNRYGLYCPGKNNVFVTHQLFIQSGLGGPADRLLMWLNYRFIRQFSVCLIPDFQGSGSLAGMLSNPPKPPPIPVEYVGILSRFAPEEVPATIPLLILISGPGPHRTAFEEKVFKELENYPAPAVVLRGLPGEAAIKRPANASVQVYNHLESSALNDLINRSQYVISRSGYSTIMDLARLRKKAILVPTPGQTEQEYLGNYLHQKKWAFCMNEETFSLPACIKIFSENEFGFPVFPDEHFSGRLSTINHQLSSILRNIKK